MIRKSLPMDAHESEIVSAVENSDVVIITADTGAGKSVRVPQMLANVGYEVCVTEPRRLAATSLASRVAEEMETEVGEKVGYSTAFEKCYSSETEILFLTDGLQLVRQINMQPSVKKKVLIIDEVHEWNLNIETLIAWAKFKIEEGLWNTKVVIMSATLEASKLANYFEEAQVIEVEGRTFPVSSRQSTNLEIANEVANVVLRGKNVLVFVSGKKEIDIAISNIKEEIGNSAVILPLHGELSMEEQKKCFDTYDIPKVVVSTNVAQTSVTVPDIDVVVDSGEEKIIESIDGVEGLYVKNCSKADILQRKGRAGRTKKGEYVLCSDVKFEERVEFSTPEIMRLNLEQVVLRLASVGIDASVLKFFHQPSYDAILRAKQLLFNLGALSQDGVITDLGIKMSHLPVSARSARMLVESLNLGVTKDVIIITAILENGSLIDYNSEKTYLSFTKEHRSDLLAEYDIWNLISKNRRINFKEEGINSKVYFKVREYINKLLSVIKFEDVSFNDDEELRDNILKACISGMVDLMHTSRWHDTIGPDGVSRNINKRSVVSKFCNNVVGFPRTIEYIDKRYGCKMEMQIINMVTVVDVSILLKFAPHLFKREKSAHINWDPLYEKCTRKVEVYYFDRFIYTDEEEVTDPQLIEYAKNEYNKRQEEIKRMYNGYRDDTPKATKQETVVVDGISYEVAYSYDQRPKIFMGADEIFNCTQNVIKLDNGTIVNIVCRYYYVSGNNIVAIKEKIKIMQIEEKVASIKSKYTSKSIKSYDEFVKALKMIGKVETDEEILSDVDIYLCMRLKNNRIIEFDVLKDKSKADELTDEAIRFFLGKEIEKRFPEKAFMFNINGKLTLTNKGSKAKYYFMSEKSDIIRQITFENFEESIEYLQIAYEEALEMLG